MAKYKQNWASYILKDYTEKVYVYLPGATTQAMEYDKYRDVNYQKNQQNYLVVNAWIRDTSANELIIRSIGLVAVGAKKLVIKNKDVNLFKYAIRIVIKDEDYYVFSDAVGNKMQIMPLDDSYSEITIFKKVI
jgi:hypothetical protein